MSHMSEQPPSTTASSQWVLTEIKGGVQVAQHRLHDPVTVLGRSEDADIILAHESCSRRHATIHIQPPSLFLQDSSTHGTIVDGKKVLQSTPLNAGDVIQFGASTRLYYIEELIEDSPLPQHAQPDQILPMPRETRQQEQPVEDASEEEEPPSLDSFLHDDSKIPERHHKEWERFKAARYKLEHIQQESERIRVKGELTEGQEKQLERNNEKEEHLQEQLSEMQESLLEKLFPKKIIKSAERESYLLDDDEVDDRTSNQTDGGVGCEAETEESLTRKFKALYRQMEAVEQASSGALHKLEKVTERVERLKKLGDDEEAFFAQNDVDLAQDELSKVKDQQHKLETSFNECCRLLKIVNPKLTVDQVTGYVGMGIPAPVPKAQMQSIEMPPPPCKPSHQNNHNSHHSMGLINQMLPPPPPKRTRVLGPAMPATDETLEELPVSLKPTGTGNLQMAPPAPTVCTMGPPTNKAPQGTMVMGMPAPTVCTMGPLTNNFARGTMAGLTGDANIVARTSNKKMESPPSLPLGKTSASHSDKVDTWQAPKDQDGSGQTKLNQKFAGRY